MINLMATLAEQLIFGISSQSNHVIIIKNKVRVYILFNNQGRVIETCSQQIHLLKLVVGPVLKIKTGFRGFENERNPGFRKFRKFTQI